MQVVRERAVDADALDLALKRHEPRGVEHARDVARGVGVPVEHEAHLDLGRRVADADAQEEAIELGLGQREGARRSPAGSASR